MPRSNPNSPAAYEVMLALLNTSLFGLLPDEAYGYLARH